MGINGHTHLRAGAFLVGILIGGFLMTVGLSVTAATSILTPSNDGITNNGAQGGTGCGSTKASCIDNLTSTSTTPADTDYVRKTRDQVEHYQLGPTLSGIDTTTRVHVSVYHVEGNGNMQTEVSLWNATENTQISAAPVLLTNNQGSPAWHTATFNSLSLNQSDTNAMRVRVACRRPGGGQSSTCDNYSTFVTAVYSEQIDIIVSTTSSQQNLERGTTTAHIGGAFVISTEVGSRNIEDITIYENGSINAATHLANVELWYELATDCSLVSYSGNETQYDIARSFSGADGSVTFSESPGVSVGTAQDMCVYVVLDVSESAGIGDTIEVYIADASVDVVGSGGATVRPIGQQALADTTTVEDSFLVQSHYHWRDEIGGETTANSLTSTDDTKYLTASPGSSYRLRMQVQNTGNASSPATQYRLQYATKSLECSSLGEGAWTDLSATADWNMTGVGSGLTEGSNTTNVAEANGGVADGTGTFVGTNGQKTTSATTSAVALPSTDYYEMEFAVTADSGVSEGTTYCFRVSDQGAPIDSYTIYPEISIAADVTVSATSTQVATIDIPTNNAWVGGGFVIQDTGGGGGHTVDSVTITASTTALVADAFDTIDLWYETDTTGALDCTGETFNGDETLYGSNSAFSVNGTSTYSLGFGNGPTVSSSQGLCFYVELNVNASSSDGQKIEIRIADASTDVVLNAGSVSPAALVDIAGDTTLVDYIVTQEHYHWRDNLGTEATANSLTEGVEDTVYDGLPRVQPIRLRFGVSNTGGTTTPTYQYQLEWAQRVSACADVTEGQWTAVEAAVDEWEVVSTQLIDNNNTTNIDEADGGVSNVGAFVGSNSGQQNNDDISNPIAIPANSDIELEWGIQATNLASEGSSYCFRMTDNGTPLDGYNAYGRVSIKLATDFRIQRGTSTIQNGATTVSITAGNEYLAPTTSQRAFIRIINAHHTGAGPEAGTTGNSNANNVTAYISNPGNITSGITFQRFGNTDTTLIAWEIIEYTGVSGGENEIIVRGTGNATYGGTATAVNSATISGVTDDAQMVPFITAQANPNTGRQNFNTGLSTAAWNNATDDITFTRGEGADAVVVSYAAVEFVGSNWRVIRAEKTYDDVLFATTTTISPVVDPDKTFIHAQNRVGTNLDSHANFGHRVWLSSMGAVSFQLDAAATSPTLHTSVAWIIENQQGLGTVMNVEREPGNLTDGGGGLTISQNSISPALEDTSVTSIFFNGSSGGTGRSFPEPMMAVQLTADDEYTVFAPDNNETMDWRIEIVEWPTAARKLVQDDFQLFYDDGSVTPTDPWPQGGTLDLGENAALNASYQPIAEGENIRIRMNVRVTAASMPAGIDAFQLEYGEINGTCDAIDPNDWKPIGDLSSTTALWRGYNGTSGDDGDTLASTVLTFSNVAGTYEEESPTVLTPNLALVDDYVEFDWNVQHNGATQKTEYCFRMVEGDGSELFGYDAYPIMLTAGYGPVIGNWRFYEDETTIPPGTPLGASENTAPSSIPHDEILQLRLTLAEKSGADGVNPKFKVQYSEFPNFSQDVFDVVSSSTCARLATTTAQIWCYGDGAGNDNDSIQEALISDADACTGGVGAGCGLKNEATTTPPTGYTHTKNTNAEFEFTLQNQGARANTVYYFRLYDLVNDEVVVASSSYPSLQVAGPELNFSLSGLPAGTTTEGIVSDVSTTATTVDFGSVPFDTEVEGAYRLRVDTGATEGYQVFMFARSPLLNTYGEQVPDVTGTNATPDAWLDGCADTTLGCFGYHTGDDILSGGSTRFSPDNTYAAFSTSPEEIMYSSAPTDDTVDIIYKIQVGKMLSAGDYETEVVYLAVPSF